MVYFIGMQTAISIIAVKTQYFANGDLVFAFVVLHDKFGRTEGRLSWYLLKRSNEENLEEKQ